VENRKTMSFELWILSFGKEVPSSKFILKV